MFNTLFLPYQCKSSYRLWHSSQVEKKLGSYCSQAGAVTVLPARYLHYFMLNYGNYNGNCTSVCAGVWRKGDVLLDECLYLLWGRAICNVFYLQTKKACKKLAVATLGKW